MKLRCHFNLHDWSMWSEQEPEVRAMYSAYTRVKIEGSQSVRFIQNRRCQDCRKLDTRVVRE